MNPRKTFQAGIRAGLLLCTCLTAAANTLVTFQVDMTTAAFDPSTQIVAVRGSFDGFQTTFVFPLTNNPGTQVWSGTTNVPFNSKVMSFKYTIDPGATWEGSHNRLATLPAASGATLILPKPYFGDNPPTPITTSVTFQVDMAQQINTHAFDVTSSSVYARGGFNGWSTDTPMTNDPSIHTTNQFGLVTSNVYVMTYDVGSSPGQTIPFKFYFDTGATWESPAPNTGDPNDNNNRFFSLAETGPQILPIVYFSDAPYAPVASSDVSFQVDMSAQVLSGRFDPTTGGTVEVKGNFNGWGTTHNYCTNDPGAANTNIYTAVIHLSDGVGATEQYKFFATVTENGGWETMADNRTFQLANATSQTLPLVYFNNAPIGDVLPADTWVTFSVNMTNAIGTDGHAFDSTADSVFINGLGFNPTPPMIPFWLSWDPTSLAAFQLTNNPVGSKLYSLPVLIPKGTMPFQLSYQYSINGGSNEPPAGVNHVRYVRSTGTYTMPLDTFGTMVTEPSFGNLLATPSTTGHVLISWLGRPGVNLQTTDALNGRWVNHPETDGLSSTNWPSASGPLYFRLIKPQVP